VDTKSILGVLSAEREFTVEDGAIDKIAADYLAAEKSGNSSRASALRKKLLAVRFSRKIGPGQEIAIDKPLSQDMSVAAGFSAKIKWYPEKDGLRAVVNVIDPSYAKPIDNQRGEPQSIVYVLVTPSGVEKDISLFMVQKGADESALVQLYKPAQRSAGLLKSAAKATWKSALDGYSTDVHIPWADIQGYESGWSVMPVEAVVCSMSNGLSVLAMTKEGDPFSSVRSYSVLTSK
jgi:hypothetical protein